MAARNPYPALLTIAVIPLLALLAIWRWADGRVPEPISEPSTSVAAPLPTQLSTPLLSARRAPRTLAGEVDNGKFQAALKPALDQIGGGGCLALSVDGMAVAAKQDNDSLRPASNVKVFTAAVALARIGADFRYTTTVRGTLAAGVVDGDLYLVGGGDPVLSEAWWKTSTITLLPPTVITDIATLADQAQAAGVTRITGNIVGDGSRYDQERFAPTVTKEVKAQMEALPVSALVVNDTRTSSTAAAADPEVGAAQVFARLLTERGITVGGKATAGTAPEGAAEITKIESAPFTAILQEMLATSDNLSAEMILKEIAAREHTPGSRQDGLKIVGDTLNSWGVPLDGTTLVDGSGLSDENRTTCAALLKVLQHGKIADAVGQGFPIAGDPGGTLANVFTDSPVKGKLRAKTGTLNNYDGVANKPGAKSLAGYYPVDGGGQIEFVLLLNGETITNKTEYRPVWNALATALDQYPFGPTVTQLGVP